MQTFLFINRSSVNSSALCWGHRNRGANWKVAGVGRSPSAARLCSASVRMASKTAAATHSRPAHLPCFTAAVFLGAVPPTGIIIKTKDWESLFRLHTCCCSLNRFASGRRSLWSFENVYSEKVANVLETPDSNKTDWEGFCLCSVLQCYICFFFFFTVSLSTTFFLFL